jgi:hypothetical protein
MEKFDCIIVSSMDRFFSKLILFMMLTTALPCFTDMRNKNIDGKPVRLSKKQNAMNLPRCSLQNSKIQSSVYQVPLNVLQAGDASNVASGQEER